MFKNIMVFQTILLLNYYLINEVINYLMNLNIN